MTIALVILAYLTVLVASGVTVYAVAALAQARHETQQVLVENAASHAEDVRVLLRAVIGKHAGDVVQLQRSDQFPDLVAAQAEVARQVRDPWAQGDEDFIDPETKERMTPVGLGG